jgi:hypothetical protein
LRLGAFFWEEASATVVTVLWVTVLMPNEQDADIHSHETIDDRIGEAVRRKPTTVAPVGILGPGLASRRPATRSHSSRNFSFEGFDW